MPVVTSDLLLKYSINAGSIGNSLASTAVGSVGGHISTTTITNNTINNLFTDITGDLNASYSVDYRCVFLHNANAFGVSLDHAVLWITNQVVGGATILLGVDPTPASNINATLAQAVTLSTTSTPLTSGVAAGVSTVAVTNAVPVNNGITIDTGAVAETHVVTAVTGTGPYNLAISPPLAYAHSSGASVTFSAPTGVSFPYTGTSPNQVATPVSKLTGLSLGTIPAGQCKALWYQRLAENSAALDNDAVSIRIDGDSSQ